jgi:streptogramin lyase
MRRSRFVGFAACLATAAWLDGCTGEGGATGPAGAVGSAGAAGAAGAAGDGGAVGDAPATATAPAYANVPNLQLPAGAFYPQGIHSSADGTLYVGSVGLGEVVRFSPKSLAPEVIVAPSNPPVTVTGVHVDDATSTLFVCADTFGPGFKIITAELRSYDLTGKLKKAFPLAQGAECEDIEVDAKHNVYVVDSFLGAVYILPGGQGSLEPWASDDLLKPSPTGLGFGAHGIATDGAGTMFVTNFDRSSLVRIPIMTDGSAGTPTAVTVTPALDHPEALRRVDANTLVIVEDIQSTPTDGRLTQLELGANGVATGTTLRNGLLNPTSVAIANGNYWISEGQIVHLLDPSSGPPSLPFLVERLQVE